jgi:squalene-hopene/tetraprenyl-beta-curcumene cyclase
MTYAGLKSMIYAGLKKDDPRVKAALHWIQEHWTLDENPAMRDANPAQAQHGLYYYFYVYAHALHAFGEPVITDKQGQKHDWRAELIAKAGQLQRSDGSWVGEKRWMEDNPVLVTAYVVLALQQTK